MTTASSLQSRQVPRQNAPAGIPRNGRNEAVPTPARALKAVPLFPADAAAEDDEFRLNLSDLPRLSTGLNVDGFQPSLTSRVLDLIDRLRKR